jgi:hypothetical protein
MKVFSRAAQSREKLPVTNLYNLLDGQLLLALRSWGSSDYNQKFIDEITHYLSSTQADLDVTTPFEYQESLSALANRTRVALLLAHDLFLKSENKSEYLVGFESLVLFKVKNELAWSSVGRFSIDKIAEENLNTLMRNGSDLDDEVLLPVQLVGVERAININSGAAVFDESSRFVVSSFFRCELRLNPGASDIESLIDVAHNNNGAYWFSVLTSG